MFLSESLDQDLCFASLLVVYIIVSSSFFSFFQGLRVILPFSLFLWQLRKESLSNDGLCSTFLTRLTRRVPLVEQELLTLPEHVISPPLFSGVRVTRFAVLCVCCLSFFFWPLCCLYGLKPHQYRQNEKSPLILTHWTLKKGG
jgi:hypothetical protein